MPTRVASLLAAGYLAASPLMAAPPGPEGPRVRAGDAFVPTFTRDDDTIRVGVVLEGRYQELDLRPHSDRSDSLRIRVDEGGVLRDVATPPPSTYWATFENGSAAMSLRDGALRGMVRLGHGKSERTLAIEPLGGGRHIAYDVTDVIASGGRCGSDDLLIPGAHAAAGGDVIQRNPGDCLRTILVAFDADFEMYQLAGSDVDATVADIEGVMNDVNFIYERDTGVTHLLGTFIVRSDAADPYTTTDAGGRLTQFQTEWNTNQAGVPRDAAHFFTGANLNGGVIGVAWVGVICDFPDYAYGLSETYYGGSYAERVGLTAHELGHNWGAGHCDGDPDCGIMCSFINGCPGGVTQFGSRSIAAICDWVETRDCDQELCPCAADLDDDGDADADDFFTFLDLFAAGDDRADLDGDGDRDADDFFLYLDAFAAC